MSEEHKIKFLEGVGHIRLRPTMYTNTITNPDTLVKELIDNAIDETLNGYGKRINIETKQIIQQDKTKTYSYLVEDDCGGLPLHTVAEQDNQIAAKLIFLKVFSSGKFTNDRYKFSSGLNGVGLTLVNALSTKMIARVNDRKTRRIYFLETKKGVVTQEKWCTYKDLGFDKSPWWSTSIYTEPDSTIYATTKTKINDLSLKLVVSKGIQVVLNGQEVKGFDPKEVIDNNVLHDYLPVILEVGTITLDLYFSWSTTEFDELSKGVVNLSPCHQGLHIREVKYALGKALCSFSTILTPDDVKYGLRLFVGCFSSKPIFVGQTKHSLSGAKDWESKVIQPKLEKRFIKLLTQNEEFKNQLIRKLEAYKKQIAKLSDMQFIDTVVKMGYNKRSKGLGAGIYDCTSLNREQTELYITEGTSASGNLLQKRDKRTQAILSLRGKPLNVTKVNDIKEILENKEILNIVNSVGIGIYPNEDIAQCRYGKVIICNDSDEDGMQILALLVGAFAFLTPSLLDAGKLYSAEAPLYKQNGKYLWGKSKLDLKKTFSRFKGLGSMNPDELKESLFDEQVRHLKRVTLDDKTYILSIFQSSHEKRNIMLKNQIIKEEIIPG